jgi:aldehyde dehydrogenase (NAD+)
MKEYKLFINGEYVESSNNTIIDDINPWTGEVYAKLHMASEEDIDKAISIAHKVSKAWANTPAKEREAVLLRAASIIEKRSDEIKDILIQEAGAAFGKAMFETFETADVFRVAAGEARRVSGQTHSSNTPNVLSYSVRRPLGVIAGISPFNFPMILAGKKTSNGNSCWKYFCTKTFNKYSSLWAYFWRNF